MLLFEIEKGFLDTSLLISLFFRKENLDELDSYLFVKSMPTVAIGLLYSDETANCRIVEACRRGYSQVPIRLDVRHSRRVSITLTAPRPAAPATRSTR